MADLETIPVLRAADLAESQTYFQRLGFACEVPAPDYLIVRRAGIELHVCPPDAPDRPEDPEDDELPPHPADRRA